MDSKRRPHKLCLSISSFRLTYGNYDTKLPSQILSRVITKHQNIQVVIKHLKALGTVIILNHKETENWITSKQESYCQEWIH